MVWWSLAALATDLEIDPALALERGHVAIEIEDYAEARVLALSVLGSQPTSAEAQQLYLEAMTGGGLAVSALFELAHLEEASVEWTVEQAALESALSEESWSSVKATVKEIAAKWPDRPDLFAPLWTSPQRQAVRIRSQLLDQRLSSRALTDAKPETLYRLRRLVLDSPDTRTIIDGALASRGESLPERAPQDRLGRATLAQTLSKSPSVSIPWGYPDEIVDVGARLETYWALARRWRDVAVAWQQIQQHTDDPTACTREALAWIEAGDLAAADVAIAAAVVRATSHTHADLAAMDSSRQRGWVSEVLRVRAMLALRREDTLSAYADYATAVLLARHPLDAAMGERLEEASARMVPPRRYPGPVSAESALAVAWRSKGPDVLLAAQDARFFAALGSDGARLLAEAPELYTDLFAKSWQVMVEPLRAAGRLDEARAASLIATLLVGDEEPLWWSARARLQEELGERDAAFASNAVARGLGVRDLEPALERLYTGLSVPLSVADHLGGPPPEPTAAPRRQETPKTGRPATAPQLGKPFPSFVLSTDGGELTERMLAGKAYIMTFWRSDCASCLQTLREFGALARVLRKGGRDIQVIGVSVDGDEANYDAAWHQAKTWCELSWAPELAPRFGIDSLPSTWVVDSQGIARQFFAKQVSAEALSETLHGVE